MIEERMAEMASVEEMRDLLSFVPAESGVHLALAYGSGALPQTSATNLQVNMADFVLVVDDAHLFHRLNLQHNARHYSAIRHLGAASIARFQRHYAAAVFYNTRVRIGDRMIKYGVIHVDDLIADLLDWHFLYISGRLHKPTLRLTDLHDARLQSALDANLKSALHAALLLLPETFTLEQLYMHIAALSYDGDFRSTVGEDRNKVQNIVRANMHRFWTLYEPYLTAHDRVQVLAGGRVTQDGSALAVYHNLNMLPSAVLHRLQEGVNQRQKWNRDLEEATFAMAHRRDCAAAVRMAIAAIVRRSAWRQSLKNILSAGVYNSVAYSWRKMSKMIRSL